ncbi:MAG: hypothetical protein Q9170_006949 [Blastenia crenularia]
MASNPLVEIPPGYCFLPSCNTKPTSTSTSSTTTHSRSLTTSTTTIFGPTFTATAPTHSKRAASAVPMLGTHSYQAFPTDRPVQVGNGPICIVSCEWARLHWVDIVGEMGDFDSPPPHSSPMPALRPISDEMTTSTTISMHKPTTTAAEPSMVTSARMSVSKSVMLASESGTSTFLTPTSPPIVSATPSPHHGGPPAARVVGLTVVGIASLALLLGVAWIITRKIRRVKAKLNVRTKGVHRDREREIYENDGGRGIPEFGNKDHVELREQMTGPGGVRGGGDV